MPANTSPDNIQYPVSTDQVAPLNTVFENLANSVQSALTLRGPTNPTWHYRWTNAAARTAQTGMRAGDVGYQADTNTAYYYNGSSWEVTIAAAAPFAVLTRTANQGIANLTDTTINWTSMTSGGAGWVNSSGVITVPNTGVYLFTFKSMWLANGSATGTTRRLYVTRNGTTQRVFDNHIVATAATADHAMSTTGMQQLNAGDTIQFRVIHNGGATLNLGPLSSGEFSCRVQYLSP